MISKTEIKSIVESMTKEEITKEIVVLERIIQRYTHLTNYQLEEGKEIISILIKSNPVEDAASLIRLAAHECGKLDAKLYV